MAKVKGTGNDILRRVLDKYGPDMYARFLDLIPEHVKHTVLNAPSYESFELDTDEEKNPLMIAAKLLYPDEDKKIRRLGKEMALYGFSVVYKMFLLFQASPIYLKKQLFSGHISTTPVKLPSKTFKNIRQPWL